MYITSYDTMNISKPEHAQVNVFSHNAVDLCFQHNIPDSDFLLTTSGDDADAWSQRIHFAVDD